jgi:hypothetical protein
LVFRAILLDSDSKLAKQVIAVSAVLLILTAAVWPQKAKKTIENGIEVISNPLELPKLAGRQPAVFLTEELRIDLGKADLVEAGLAEPVLMDVDSEGNIYVSTQRSSTHFIFKLDRTGKLLTSFGRKGQGPGELQFPTFERFSPREELFVVDHGRRKVVIFSKAGGLIRENPVEFSTPVIWPLLSGKYLATSYENDPEAEYWISRLFIIDENWQNVAELDTLRSLNMNRANKVDGVPSRSILADTREHIFWGNSERGYEIRVYNHEGFLLRKIKKEYKRVNVDEEFKKGVRERFSRASEILQKLYFSKTFPPFQFGFGDETGYLFVMTYEKGKNAGEFIYDIFNPDGVFVARTALPNYGHRGVVESALFAMAKKARVYCFRENESGFEEIVVYKLNRG